MYRCDRRRRHVWTASLGMLWAGSLAANHCVAQNSPGIYLSNEINTNLPTTTLGGGGPFEENFGNSTPILEPSANLSPIEHADSVTAYDPSGNGIYTVTASAAVNVLSVYKGQISVSDQASAGGNAPDIEQSSAAIANAEWSDMLLVGGLPTGAKVTLRITEVVDATLRLNCPACASGGYNSVLNHGTQILDLQTGGGIGPSETLDATGSIKLRKSYLFKTYSGDSVFLADFVTSDLSGRGVWTGSASVNVAVLYVDPVTPGATVSSTFGDISYATPTDLLSVPSVVSENQALAEATLSSEGFTVGTISSVPSATVPAGIITAQVPAAGTGVVQLYPINLVMSSGPPQATCAADASALVSVSQSGYRYNSITTLYDQTVTITNTSATTIKSPINLVLENLNNAALNNSEGASTCAAPGSPYVTIARGLAPGKSVKLPLQFAAAKNAEISWTPEVDVQGQP